MRERARWIWLALFASLAAGIVLTVAFDPEVQTMDAAELFERRDDARAFLAADYVFIVIYAVISPILLWRFGNAVTVDRLRMLSKVAAVGLVLAGIADALENTLLWSATDSVSEDAVDAAHDVAVAKWVFAPAAIVALAVNVWAYRLVRAGPARDSEPRAG